jgi:hypothetical protein
MNDIPEEDLRTLEERFGDRFLRHAAAEADAEESFASVFPESAEENESLTRLATRHEIPLMGAEDLLRNSHQSCGHPRLPYRRRRQG